MLIRISRISGYGSFILSILFIIAGVVGLKAQDQSSYVISAKAGGINFASGEATYLAKGDSQARSVTNSDVISSGDRLMTGPDGRVELLLNPGSYLRLAGDSEIELADSSLDSLQVKLLKGAAIIEKRESRDDLYLALNEKRSKVGQGVAGSAAYGNDSPLYGAMGFVRKRDRASGLTRKKITPNS